MTPTPDPEARPKPPKDPPSEAVELKEAIIGRDKPIELAFQEAVERIVGKCRWEIRDDVLHCFHSRGTGSTYIPFLHELLEPGRFASFAESYAHDLIR